MSEPSAADWLAAGRDHRLAQRMAEADAALAKAHALAPDDAQIAFLHAQLRYERGLPAAKLFAQAQRLAPANGPMAADTLRNLALAQASEGHIAEAQALLASVLAQRPDWLEGQRILASLRYTSGDAATHDAGYATALRAMPGHAGLWMGWFACIAQTRNWPRARAVLDQAAAHIGETKQVLAARLFLASENGDAAESERLIKATAALTDGFVQLARIRHHLRRRDAQSALDIALPLTQTRMAGQIWPYVSTCWRLLGDARAQWLDGAPPYVASLDIALSCAERTQLAETLRALHLAQLPYAEQSVRGGTQTDRSVLLRHEPILAHTRAALMDAVARYVAGLPPHDPAHPLLSAPRTHLRIAGSWSVKLGANGFNVTHSHPMGWISSAFYVSVPEPSAMGPAPAGHFHFGAPPPELGLDLAPYATIAPEPCHLVLFPSTMWHGTVPFAAGERLNIAFDVVGG